MSYNLVYPVKRQDLLVESKPTPSNWYELFTVAEGSAILAPATGVISKVNSLDWEEIQDDLGIDDGEIYSFEIESKINGVRVINVIGPVLYPYGTGAILPRKDQLVTRGQVLGDAIDMSDTDLWHPGGVNLKWTVFVESQGFKNPLTYFSQQGSKIQFFDDEDLVSENEASTPKKKQPAAPRPSTSTMTSGPDPKKNSPIIPLLLVGGLLWWAKGKK